MLLAVSRMAGEANTVILVEPEGDWSLLKVEMCRRWPVEEIFDDADAWMHLREGRVVFDGSAFYQVYNVARAQDMGDGMPHFRAFEGEVMEILPEGARP